MKSKTVILGFSALLALTACGGGGAPAPTAPTTGNQAPTVAIRSTANQSLTDKNFLQPGASLMILTSDDDVVKTVTYSLAGPVSKAPVQLGSVESKNTINLPPDLTEGTYTMTVQATDSRGATSTGTASFRIDTTNPQLVSVTVNGQTVGSSNISAAGTAALKVVAHDTSGPVTLVLTEGQEVLAQNSNELNFDLARKKDGSLREDGSYSFMLTATDPAGRTTQQAVNVTLVKKDASSGPVEQVPTPTLQVIGEGPFAGNMGVNASANIGPSSQLDKMVLVVTDSTGRMDSQTYVTTQANQTFSVDTTQFANGPVKLQVFAYTKGGLEGASPVQSIEVKNLNAPQISVVAPVDGSTFNAPTLPVRVTITKRTSDFSFVSGQVNVELRDYRGALKATRTLDISNPSTCTGDTKATLTCNTTFDMADGDAGIYSVTASTSVNVDGLGQQRLSATSRFTSTVQNASAPANNIILPIRISNDGSNVAELPSATAKLPVLNRGSGVMVHASDNDGLKYVQVRFLYPDGRPVNSYLLNRKMVDVSETYEVVMPIELDGSEYIPDGQYILQMTTEDTLGNTNIQEMWVRVDRAQRGQLFKTEAVFTDARSFVNGQLTHSSGAWGLGCSDKTVDATTEAGSLTNCASLQADSRVIALTYFRNPQGVTKVVGRTISPVTTAGTSVISRVGFNAEGTYWVSWLVQDLNTGVVESISGPELAVQKNSNQ